MKKLMISALVSIVACLSWADSALRIAAYEKMGNKIGILFDTNALASVVLAGWTDDSVIDATFYENDGVSVDTRLLGWVASVDGGMSDALGQKFYDAAAAAPRPVTGLMVSRVIGFMSPAQRTQFEPILEPYVASLYQGRPVRAALVMKQNIAAVGQWSSAISPTTTAAELVTLRLAPELRSTDEAKLILDAATKAAKKQLRLEGKSFVTTSYTEVVGGVTNVVVVNPLDPKLSPVVSALNAPLMTGIEAALADCGITIADQTVSRGAMSAASDGWENSILDGEVGPNDQVPYLNALKVAKGVVAYNEMIATYNGEK